MASRTSASPCAATGGPAPLPNAQRRHAIRRRVQELRLPETVESRTARGLLEADHHGEVAIAAQRARVDVLAQGRDVNVLVLDTEVYSNTGGQQSKATPLGAAAKFAAAGEAVPKKDLGLLAMSYGNVHIAQIAYGAKDAQTVKAFAEADAWPGPSLLIAYSHCIAHGAGPDAPAPAAPTTPEP